MKVFLQCLFLLASLSVSEGKTAQINEGKYSILPTFLPFEASSREPDDENMNKETSDDGELAEQLISGAPDVSDEDQRRTAVLLSEEALTELLQDVEEDNEDDGQDKQKVTGLITETRVSQKEEQWEQPKEQVVSSTDLEIPLDLQYDSNSEATDAFQSEFKENVPLSVQVLDVLPTAMMDYDYQQSNQDPEDPKDEIQETPADPTVPTYPQWSLNDPNNVGEDRDKGNKESELQDDRNSTELVEKQTEEIKNESTIDAKSKDKKKRKRHHLIKVQNDQVPTEDGQHQDLEIKADITVNTAETTHRKRKNWKWTSLLGLNPVQIRAAMDLFPRIRPTSQTKHRAGIDGQAAPNDPCRNVHCKRGKTCELKDEKTPVCVCQEPADCSSSLGKFDQVCGTDNRTYDSSCQLFATKCSLDGSKKGHRLHLDYAGSCKFIPPCAEAELVQFPLRMRDWLKNVLLQLNQQDLLTAKQRFKVQKIYESERNLHVGDQPAELLALNFEKNYHMYIYPVHWQFAQLDQHPSDRFLSHSELAPLRAPLVPLEHCASVFFYQCDADEDKLLSFREWCHCFSIKDEDMDTNLLF
ncbi:SPARC-like protein 1 [Trichomycterus rosablanca]|uniref:SPARC-like protein 1 n=1 Tax=Trichomycterus rosablanca TaxID=2290929 RepID=UPI002F35A1B8